MAPEDFEVLVDHNTVVLPDNQNIVAQEGTTNVSACVHILVLSLAQVKLPRLNSFLVGQSQPNDLVITVVPSLLEKVYLPIPSHPQSSLLRNLTLLDINHDIAIPNFFNDL